LESSGPAALHHSITPSPRFQIEDEPEEEFFTASFTRSRPDHVPTRPTTSGESRVARSRAPRFLAGFRRGSDWRGPVLLRRAAPDQRGHPWGRHRVGNPVGQSLFLRRSPIPKPNCASSAAQTG